MRKAHVWVLAVVLLSPVSSSREQASALRLSVTAPTSTEPVAVVSAGIKVLNSFSGPEILGSAAAPAWSHANRSETDRSLAGIPGTLTADRFLSQGIELVRETWVAQDGRHVAFRHRIHNTGSDRLRLSALHPLDCRGPEALTLPGSEPKRWTVLVEERHKNGLPRALSPVKEPDLEGDPFLLLRGNAPGSPDLLIGHVSQTGSIAGIRAQFADAASGSTLKRLFSDCQFDGIALPPDGERSSQWAILSIGESTRDLIDGFADAIGRYHGVSQPAARPPSLFCSWYYHGFHYTEQNFHEDLAALEKKRMPFDVFLIDECWDLNHWGDFQAIASWPSGMKDAAERIRALGYRPGIWTCPYLVDFDTELATKHPNWLLKNNKGQNVVFTMNQRDHWVLDPTYPGVCDFLEETYRELAHDWGYEYFKFDFMRAVFVPADQKFYNPELTRLEAYRMGLEAIRRGTGPDAYISVCGGHYGGSLGIADSQRSGSDVLSIWRDREIPKFRQNILRTWMSRLWHVDPDAMMVRRNKVKAHEDKELSLGLLSDAEAQTVALNQYIGGGLVTFTEPLARLDEDRRALYRHVIPSINSRSVPLDLFDPLCPGIMLTKVEPLCRKLDPWVTISLVNWTDREKEPEIRLGDAVVGSLNARQFLVFDFWKQEVLGIFPRGALLELEPIAPHACRLIRVAPWTGRSAVLAGTDLHFSGGAVEIESWKATSTSTGGRISTNWDYPVAVTVAFPDSEKGFVVRKTSVDPHQPNFSLRK